MNRREVLAGLLGASTLAVVGRAQGKSAAENDFEILLAAIELEQRAIETYRELVKLLKSKEYMDMVNSFVRDHAAHKEALVAVIANELKMQPRQIEVTPFQIPSVKKDVDAVRYAAVLETVIAKSYYDGYGGKLLTRVGRSIFLDICAVEAQHVGVLRTLLVLKLKDKIAPYNGKVVPYALMELYGKTELPQ
ncbi:MAG: ferritin-like domain-containing protein [Acidobacteriota bacterium]|nr:ferritin-like domain-containing protein [Blastocatellia bacterium]MDW8411947.1 ferritin-like domain-containing protein [Acidobacteriota bacterium]